MTRRDKWAKRPCVLRYWQFKRECHEARVNVTDGCTITFVLPMPNSWPPDRRAEMNLQPHRQKPDIDNLTKALLDAIYSNDAHISKLTTIKLWGEMGTIIIEAPAL